MIALLFAGDGAGDPGDRLDDMLVACALDRAEDELGVVAGLLEPGADHRSGADFRQAEGDQDRNAFAPQLVSAVGVDRGAVSGVRRTLIVGGRLRRNGRSASFGTM